MKKIILTIIFLIFINTFALAQINVKDTLTGIETGLFGYDYKNDSDIRRIERIEEYMYGEKKTGTVQSRLELIQNDTGIIVQEKKPKKLSPNDLNDEITNKTAEKSPSKPSQKEKLVEDDTVEYAIVDKMEKSVFNKTYKNDSIYDRLDRLETTVFQQKGTGDLSARVDRLASVVCPSSRKVPAKETSSVEEMEKLFKNNGVLQLDDQTIPFHLAVLENDVFRHEYVGDNNASRLTRLEQKLFNRSFPSDTDIQRLQRLMVAYDAKKDSYKYENNKRMQNVATMSQLGGILLMILAILL